MKKIVCIMVTILMILSVAACAKKVEPEQENEPTVAPVTDDGTKDETEATSEPEEETGMQPISEPVTITAWYTFGNVNEQNFLAAVEAFNASQEYIKVEATQQTWNEIDAKIMAALTANTQPDLIFCSSAAATNNYVDMNVAVDLNPYITDPNIGISDFDDYNAAIIGEAQQWDGQMYMFPISRTGEVMYYNADFFAENNLTPRPLGKSLKRFASKSTP
jgi:ABC-type sugar transport system, periplasmic component